MIKYEVITINEKTENIKATFDDSDLVLMIPVDETNSDYQAYLNKDKPKVEHLTEISTGAKEL